MKELDNKNDIKKIVSDSISNIKEPKEPRLNVFTGKKVFNNRVHYFSNPGKTFQAKYRKYYDKNGEVSISVVEYINLVDFICSSFDETNIDILYKRYTNGDMSVKRHAITVAGQLNDFRNVPKDIIEANNFILNLKASFDSLPVELKSKFDNNYMKFANSSRDGSAINIVNQFLQDTYKNINLDDIKEKQKGDNNNENG